MKTTLVLISLCSLCSINAAPLKRTRQPTTTTDAGFVAKYFRIPEFLKFSRNERTTEPPIKTVELPQKSRLSRILDSVNIFKKEPFGEPYLRAYVQPDGSYKWYFVYPGQMLYPAPDDFSLDLQRTLPPTTPTTTTTTTTERPTDPDDEYKPLYPLGKIEFVKNETEPKENKGAITISDDGPIFQPYAKIIPPFDEPLQQQFQVDGEDDQEQQEEPEPVEENASVTRKNKKHAKTPPPEEETPAEDEEQAEDQPAADEPEEQAQDENQPDYENGEPEENSPDDENAADDENEAQAEDEDNPPPADERTPAPATKTKSQKRKPSG